MPGEFSRRVRGRRGFLCEPVWVSLVRRIDGGLLFWRGGEDIAEKQYRVKATSNINGEEVDMKSKWTTLEDAEWNYNFYIGMYTHNAGIKEKNRYCAYFELLEKDGEKITVIKSNKDEVVPKFKEIWKDLG